MNFVKNLNIHYVDAKEIPCLTGQGEPTLNTVGAVGCLYMDEQTGEVYKCTSVADGEYAWEKFASNSSSDSSGGVTIDLLWENLWDSDEFEEQEISIPDIGDYDIIEIAHRNNDSNEATTRISMGGYGEGYLSFASAGYGVSVNSRYFWINAEDGKIGFGTGYLWRMPPQESGEAVEAGDDNFSCVPSHIYGIKDVNKTRTEGKFTIDGDEYSFTKGYTWNRWCGSRYNTIGLYSSGDYIKGDGGNSTLGLVGDGEVDGRDLIVDGGKYEML